MGLDIVVGIASAENVGLDPEATEHIKAQFELLNQTLRGNGLQEHREPWGLPTCCYSARIGPYGQLHKLRRVAAHLWAGKPIPPPLEGDLRATEDPVLRRLYATGGVDTRPLLRRLFGRSPWPGPRFPHLVGHGDAEGYYVPQDFSIPLMANGPTEIITNGVGSCQQLLRECELLAAALSLPPTLDPESADIDELRDGKPPQATWHHYPAESYVCLRLIGAAKASIASGAAIVFC